MSRFSLLAPCIVSGLRCSLFWVLLRPAAGRRFTAISTRGALAEKLDDRYQLLTKGNRFGMLTLRSDGAARSALKERLLAHPNLKLYEPLLKAASVEFAVDLALLKAVIAAEACFDPVAEKLR